MNMFIGLLEGINRKIAALGDNSGLLLSPQSWSLTLYDYSSGISDVVFKPLAYTLLAIFLMMELYHLSQRCASLGGTQQLAVQQVGMLLIKAVLCKWAIDNALILGNGILEIFHQLTQSIAAYVGDGYIDLQLDTSTLAGTVGTNIFDRISAYIAILIPCALVNLAVILVNTIVAARFIEIYILLAVAPLPLSTFCSHELHNIAVNYCKLLAAAGLQGVIIYLVLGFFPALVNVFFSPNTTSVTDAAWDMAGLTVILLVALFSSGRLAKSLCNAA